MAYGANLHHWTAFSFGYPDAFHIYHTRSGGIILSYIVYQQNLLLFQQPQSSKPQVIRFLKYNKRFESGKCNLLDILLCCSSPPGECSSSLLSFSSSSSSPLLGSITMVETAAVTSTLEQRFHYEAGSLTLLQRPRPRLRSYITQDLI